MCGRPWPGAARALPWIDVRACWADDAASPGMGGPRRKQGRPPLRAAHPNINKTKKKKRPASARFPHLAAPHFSHETFIHPSISVFFFFQSSGKSSVLEAVVGRDFLPRGTGIVTRR